MDCGFVTSIAIINIVTYIPLKIEHRAQLSILSVQMYEGAEHKVEGGEGKMSREQLHQLREIWLGGL